MSLLYYSYMFAILCFSIAAFFNMIRIMRGPTPQDRVLGSDALSVNAIMILLTLGMKFGTVLYFDISMLLALIGFVSAVALSKFLLRGEVIEP